MGIKIHRGLDQIGGCITEIWTDSSRVFIDFGQNLPGNGTATTALEDEALVNNILTSNPKLHEAVFYTHGHEDHIGLFEHIPPHVTQYMSEGTKSLLAIKYELLAEGAKLTVTGLKSQGCDNDEYSEALKQASYAELKCELLDRVHTWQRTPPRRPPKAIIIGNISVTPFYNCHSIYDAHMFLIEAHGKRIWHTGDYRAHGYLGKGLFPTLSKYATNIDVLITEGTMLHREDRCIHEQAVAKRMASVMRAFKYVFVLASATDLERLTSIKEASKHAGKPLCICSLFLKRTMEFFTLREALASRGLFAFEPLFYNEKLLPKLQLRGFTMVAGTSQIERIRGLVAQLAQRDTLLIYSHWDGYYLKPEQLRVNTKYQDFRAMFRNVVDIHTSGHADRATIQRVIDTIQAKELIYIHKEPD